MNSSNRKSLVKSLEEVQDKLVNEIEILQNTLDDLVSEYESLENIDDEYSQAMLADISHVDYKLQAVEDQLSKIEHLIGEYKW